MGVELIDINADLGEGIGPDREIMPLISSCNIACGGHAGDARTMEDTLLLARRYRVKGGAHPSFPDKENFGRKVLSLSNDDLFSSLVAQLREFKKVCEGIGLSCHHVKAHGALYNQAAKDPDTANCLLSAVEAVFPGLLLYVPYGSTIHRLAMDRFPLWFETFIDRRYESDGRLRSRTHSDAVIHDSKLAWGQLKDMLQHNRVTSVDGQVVSMQADTYCIHSDHPNAVTILGYIHGQLAAHEIELNK